MRHEAHVAWLAVAAAAVPSAIALPLLWLGDFELKTQVTLTLLIGVSTALLAATIRERVVRPLQTLGNLTAALREGDYSVRGRRAGGDDALGLALAELSALSAHLREERHGAEELSTGLGRVVESLDVAVLAADRAGAVRVANRAAARTLGRGDAVGQTIADLGIAELFAGETPRTVRLPLPGGEGPWLVRSSEVRLSGLPHRLIVLTDVHRALRAEERDAWRRLVRVLGHEINNSLGPIRSIADTLRASLTAPTRPADLDDDLIRGLAVIQRRSEALSRFMTAYARLARLPPPTLGVVAIDEWVKRAADLEPRVAVERGPAAAVLGDADQLDQLLINLITNAIEAVKETGQGDVRVSWDLASDAVVVSVEDDGPGIADASNLFVPFFTTKPTGSGIGLVLSRQIAEAHGGALLLRNRGHHRGCQAIVTLPRARSAARDA